MKKGQVIALVVMLGIFIFVGIYFLKPKEDFKLLEIQNAKASIEADMETLSLMKEEVDKWVNPEEDSAIYLPNNEKLFSEFRDREGVVEFFGATILMEDPNLFIQSFSTEVISKDLFSESEKDKMKVTLKFINEISRNGKLEHVSYQEKKGVLGTTSSQSYIRLIYSDGLEVDVELAFDNSIDQHIEDEHSAEENIVLITTPVHTIIEKIKSTN